MIGKKIQFSLDFLVKTIFFMALLVVTFFPFMAKATSGEPDVATMNVTNITNNSATLNGTVDGNNYSTTAWFEYGTDTGLDDSTPRRSQGDRYENYEDDISGLYANTTYYFRAVARNSRGTMYGSIFSFRTNSDYYYSNINYYDQQNYSNNYNSPVNSLAPTAITESATGALSTSVQLNSLILNPMGNPLNAWFEWGTTPDLGNRTVTTPVGTLSSVKLMSTLTGLSPSTIFYFRAVAEDFYWRNNGSILTFVTSGSSTSQNTNTTTIIKEQPIIIREPAPIVATTTATQAPTEISPTETPPPLGANAASANYFLPQNLFGWIILVILFLILILEIRYLHSSSLGQKNIQE